VCVENNKAIATEDMHVCYLYLYLAYFKLPAACAMRCAFLLFAVLMATQHPNAAMNQQNQ
jgi:hypothetical protein